MRFAAAIADARHTLRVQRRQAPCWRRATAIDGGVGDRRWQYLLWKLAAAIPAALVPLALWMGQVQQSRLWGCVAFVAVLASSGQLFQFHVLSFSATDVLRQPSKAGIVLARLWRRLPRLLLVGAFWALGAAILLRPMLATQPLDAGLLLLAVALAPVAHTVGKLRVRLVGDESTFGPLLLPILAIVLLLPVWRRGWQGSVEDALSVGAAVLLLLPLPRIAIDWIRAPRLRLRVMAAELALLPRFAVAVACLAPLGDSPWVTVTNGMLPWVAPLALAAVLTLLGAALSGLPAAVHWAEEKTGGAAVVVSNDAPAPGRSRRRRVAVELPRTHRGRRSLLRAALFLYCRRTWPRPGELRSPGQVVDWLPQLPILLLSHGLGLLLAAATMLGDPQRPAHPLLAVLAGLLVPNLVHLHASPVLHRLGIDRAAQVRHNLLALFLFVALPTLLVAALAAAAAGFDTARLRLLLVLAATIAVRGGLRGLVGVQEFVSLKSTHLLPGLALLGCLAWPWPSAWPAAAVLAVALIGVARRLQRLDERRLREQMLEEYCGAGGQALEAAAESAGAVS